MNNDYSKTPVMTYFEREAISISTLGEYELQRRIINFKGDFKLDFTQEVLNTFSVDRLRHILLAAIMNARSSKHSSQKNLESRSG
ncbi:MAG TPA: hypothetical protein VJ438_03430 [Candidatus Nanoarchaeia archaeon]|nr:hypothetical protein [Candidatus Nanoarchaeia archaeon]